MDHGSLLYTCIAREPSKSIGKFCCWAAFLTGAVKTTLGSATHPSRSSIKSAHTGTVSHLLTGSSKASDVRERDTCQPKTAI